MLVWLFFLVMPSDSLKKMTSYGCRSDTLRISCNKSSRISILRASYKMLSVAICNEESVNKMRTDCGDPGDTTKTVIRMCENMQECEIKVDDKIFPALHCYETNKYFEVQYECKVRKYMKEKILPNLEQNITGLWNSREKGISEMDIELALQAVLKEKAANDSRDIKKGQKKLVVEENIHDIQIHSFPNLSVHKSHTSTELEDDAGNDINEEIFFIVTAVLATLIIISCLLLVMIIKVGS